MFFNTVVGRTSGILAQLVLAAILSQSDFGVYALAIAVSAFLTNLRGAGMYQWLIQGGQENLHARAGDTFWIGSSFNLIIGLLIVAGAAPLGHLVEDSRLVPVVITIGLSFPLTSVGSYYKTVLSVHLRMREVAFMEVASAALKAILMIVFALVGLGPLSFVLPLPITYLLEAVLGFLLVREDTRGSRSCLRDWPRRILANRWILAGTLATTVALQIDYAIIGSMGALDMLGVYFFAYQLTFMSASVITENLRRVLFPGLVSVRASQRVAASLRATRLAVILGSPLVLLVAVLIPAVEPLLWQGKWEAAILPVQVLSLALPLHIAAAVSQASLQSVGRFRMWAGVMALRGMIVGGAALAAMLGTSEKVEVVSGFMAVAFGSGALLQVLVHYVRSGVPVNQILTNLWPGIAAAMGSMICSGLLVDLALQPRVQLWTEIVARLGFFVGMWTILILTLERQVARDAVKMTRRALFATGRQ